MIFEDMLIMGSTVPETLPGSPGHIRAFDVKTGGRRWIFHTIPHPGEFGYDTWSKDSYKINGGANAWAGLSIDPKLGLVFAATGQASFDFYDANRIGDNLFADCVLALDARNGRQVWHFQGIRHDVWDLDFPAAAYPGHSHEKRQAGRRHGVDPEKPAMFSCWIVGPRKAAVSDPSIIKRRHRGWMERSWQHPSPVR